MKKKRLYLITIIALLAALFGGSGGVAWGQAFLNGPSDVNNYFGAGESATITGTNIIWPHTSPTALNHVGNRIIIGGDNANNSVIKVYNGDGYGCGWISVLRIPSPANGHTCSDGFWASFNPTGNYPYTGSLNGKPVLFYDDPKSTTEDFYERVSNPPITWAGQCPPLGGTYGTSAKFQQPIIYSFNSFNEDKFSGLHKWEGTANTVHTKFIAPCGLNLFNSQVTNLTGVGHKYGDANIIVSHHDGPMYSTTVSATPYPDKAYTSTQTADAFTHAPTASSKTLYTEKYNQDENIKLTQFKGNPMVESEALKDQKIPKSEAGKSSAQDSPAGWYIDNYQRPTTIALHSTTLDLITLDTVAWYYTVYKVQETEQDYASHGGRTTQECNSGRMFAYAFDVNWASLGTLHGDTKLDAAVQLINGATVCVEHNVEDITGHIGNIASADRGAVPPHQQTNALIVWPRTDWATLRTKGNFKANMHTESTLATNDNVKYTAAQFPDPDANIYMYSGSTSRAVGSLMHAFPSMQVPYHNYPANVATTVPFHETAGSIFGVYGDYVFTGKMANVHTDTVPTNSKGPNRGVIEAGPATANKARFHVYGRGMLKNFESCTAPFDNFPMEFGKDGYSQFYHDSRGHGGTPEFKINNEDTLYIVNFGNNGSNSCAAKLQFHTTSVDSLGIAFTGTGKGALQIQALNNVEFNADGSATSWNNTTNGNNIYVLSDAGNIVTQKLTINSENKGDPGHGLINFMAV